MQPVIYVDLRCLQDRDFQRRGIGYHTAALLRSRKTSTLSGWKTIGLVDPRMPIPPPDLASLVDEISASVNPPTNSVPALFVDGSPMTHDTRFSLRFQKHPGFLRAAVLYDFIPLDWPGYLPSPAARVEYLAKVARLRSFHLFCPISAYTASRLRELAGVSASRIHVTGASVRRSLYEARKRLPVIPSPYDQDERYFVTLGGDDRRKNTEVALNAVKRLNLLHDRVIPLKVIGFYCDAYKFDLLKLAGHPEGIGFLEFYPRIPDEEVVALHAGAIAAIAPSYIEGFSLPVPEAAVCGCPVIASTCAAHRELIEQPEALFDPGDSIGLTDKLEAVFNSPELRDSLLRSQAHLAATFHEEAVGKRFWHAISVGIEAPRKSLLVSRPQKPELAFLSPFPPDLSGAARYTSMTMNAGGRFFRSAIYTDAPRPLPLRDAHLDGGKVSLAPLAAGRYNAIVSVLGNSAYHDTIFDVFERYGGPCILHDSRLTKIYYHRLGRDKFLELASKLLGRAISMEEAINWLQDRSLPCLFLEPIIERASPLIVQTRTQQALLKKRYGADVQVATCCPTVLFEDECLSDISKQKTRNRHGIASGDFVVSSFGYVGREKGAATCIMAIELLRSWNIPAELYFVGDAGPERNELDRVAMVYDVAEHVHYSLEFVDDSIYSDFLIASDAAVQLRTYALGQLSATLTDCVSAGLPCVASNDLAESCDAPGFVARVPDRFSPLQVAEHLALIWEARGGRASRKEARAAYLQKHNFEYYAQRLVEILGIA